MSVDIALLISLITVAATLLGLQLNRDKKKGSETYAMAQIETHLAHIMQTVKDMQKTIDRQSEQINFVTQQLIQANESTKSAHKRLDGIEGAKKCE